MEVDNNMRDNAEKGYLKTAGATEFSAFGHTENQRVSRTFFGRISLRLH